MDRISDYKSKTREVASEYHEDDSFCMAVLRDSRGYLQAASEKVEELHSRLDEMAESGISVLAIYENINREGITLIENAVDDLNSMEKSLVTLLKSRLQ